MDAVTQGALIALSGVLAGQLGQLVIARQQRKKEQLRLVLEAAIEDYKSQKQNPTQARILPLAYALIHHQRLLALMDSGRVTAEELIKLKKETMALLNALENS